MMAATTKASAVRIPASPTHNVTPAPELVVAGSNAVWMVLFQAPCSAIAGQMLPVSKRIRAITKPNDVTDTISSTAEI